MTDKIREIMRLSSLGISQRVIIKAVHCSSHTIKKTIDKAQSLDISYEDIRDKSNREITDLFKGKRSLELYEERPDYEYVHNEMQKRNVTLKLLWEEYSEKCIEKGTPFMKYTQFTTLYRQYCEEHKLTMLIIDDWLLVKSTPQQQECLFEIMEGRNELHSTIFASQTRTSVWHEYLGGGTIAERYLTGSHHPPTPSILRAIDQ